MSQMPEPEKKPANSEPPGGSDPDDLEQKRGPILLGGTVTLLLVGLAIMLVIALLLL